ncbi:MAG: serine hydrolase [Chloroflexi bacterium]|nr:serine hydrolase [Chloroflexota bacterium]MCC6896430.1 serine hydrolase [Anaerolineae bacterium]
MTFKRNFRFIILIVTAFILLPLATSAQQTGATAEAIGQANLRSATDVNADLLGQITIGTRYPILARSQFYPWYLIGDPTTQQPIGWVYADLITIVGSVNNVPYSEVVVSANMVPLVSPTMTLGAAVTTAAGTPDATSNTTLPTATATPVPLTGVIGTVQVEINIRYGPGVDYPRIGVGEAGEQFEITGRHSQFPWLQIRYPAAPNGFGWVANDLLQIQGNINAVPLITQTNFNLPTLTPTPAVVLASSLLQTTPVAISPTFQALGDNLWAMMLNAGFEPETSKLASLFVMDLKTNEALTFGNKIAFSGMSLNKIAILAALYSTLEAPPDADTALNIAYMMVCSENSASNALLRKIGNGDEYQGAAKVTAMLQTLGLGNMFIVAPFKMPNATPVAVQAPTTQADQIRALPDYSNQLTVDDMGWLLASIYQCANTENGALMSLLPGQFSGRECRQMLNIMSDNNLSHPLMMSAGVPADTRVAHKHGYIDDTHGNAGIVFSPGGDYVLVVAMHGPVWLEATETFPLISDLARTIYNYLNPTATDDTNLSWDIAGVEECLQQSRDTVEMLMSNSG